MSAIQNNFEGIWTALITPMTKDGAIDWKSYATLLDRQAKSGIKGIVISGTTGESPTLSVQEKLSLIRKAKAQIGNKIMIMAGSGSSSTDQSVELSKLSVEAGADCLLIATPPYNKPSLEGLKIHYQAISDSVKCPICLYHVPGRTGQFLSADAIATLTKIPNVCLVKEASSDMTFLSRCITKSSAQFLSGDDLTFLASLAIGSKGIISVLSNFLPEPLVALWNAFNNSNLQKALTLHNNLFPLMEALFIESNPAPIKAALAQMGIGENYLRPPLAPLTPENHKKLLEIIKATKTQI